VNRLFVGESFSRSFGLLGVHLALLAGCNSSEGPPLYPTAGRLLVDGEPAHKAQVILHPANGRDFDRRGARPSGITEPDGTFRISTYRPDDGAPKGDYVVTISWPEDPDSLEPSPDRLRGLFLLPERSAIKVRIEAQQNHLQTIELKTP